MPDDREEAALQRMWNNRDEACLAMIEMHYELLAGWIAGSGGGVCSDRGNSNANINDPIHLSGGTQIRADQKKPDTSHVLGRINDPAITKNTLPHLPLTGMVMGT